MIWFLNIEEMIGTVLAFIVLSYLGLFALLCIGFFFYSLAQDVVDLFSKK